MSSPVWCWVAGLIGSGIMEIIDGNAMRVVAVGLIAYGATLIWQSTL